jgi:hypothetical protein
MQVINPTNTPGDSTRGPLQGPLPNHTVPIQKRKHQFSLKDKENILNQINTGSSSRKEVMDKYGINNASFVRDWTRGMTRASTDGKFVGLDGLKASKRSKTTHTGGQGQYPEQSE